jgi:hypothetical protein
MRKSDILNIICEALQIAIDTDDYQVAEVLSAIVQENHDIDDFVYLTSEDPEDTDKREELQGFIDEFDLSDSDQVIEFDGNEYRIIRESDIWDIYKEEIKNIVEDCYSDVLKLDKVPDFIALEVDWEQTAKNAYADGYGHTFSSYDHSEIETKNHYIFRTN